ncbi:hypothetical protein D3248_07765 [Leucobacter zeae]|nr:hypothetical protein [Leucobacter zeae]
MTVSSEHRDPEHRDAEPPRPAANSHDAHRVAQWRRDGDDIVLRFRGADLRAAMSPAFVSTAAGIGVAAGLVAALAGMEPAGALLTGALALGLVLSLVSFVRLSLAARDVELVFGVGSLATRDPERRPAQRLVDDGAPPGDRELPYSELSAVLIVHDGPPSRIRVRARGRRRGARWVIGGLYRHPAVEAFIDAVPDALHERLRSAGFAGGAAVRRRIRWSEYRAVRGSGGGVDAPPRDRSDPDTLSG